ncbi:MAG: carbohydrate binding family 9 domain-containing protein [Cyclobacteriaceae bacterium]
MRGYLSILIILVWGFAYSQNGTILSERPVTSATQIEQEPTIDGQVIDDPVWDAIAPITDLVQIRPDVGQKVSEKTEIRLAYTPTTFYLSVICYDSEPEKLVVSDARRDANLDDTDAFLFILDTYHDQQNGFVFGTNSIGIEYDAQVDNEGQGNFNQNRQQGGVIGGFNLNWDGSWTVKTDVGDYGWSAEFAIPLKTIRFKTGDDVTWGANFQRIIRKRNELAYWAPLPIQFDLKRLSLAGDIEGLSLKSPGNLKVIPYGLGQANRIYDTEPVTKNDRLDAGVDVKYSVTPSVTLDLTYNTDFAQVEVDDQQVNLDRFNLFFPEKRPFFLENAGLFSVGSPGEVDLFFSRRIGLNSTGEVIPIIGGARLSGRVDQTNIGVLSMFTETAENEDYKANSFNVARVNHQLAARSTVGAAYISKGTIGDPTNDYNRVFAGDTKIGFGKKAQIQGFYAKSQSPEIDSQDNAYQLKASYQWNGLNLTSGYTEVQEGFNPEAGFLGRGAFRKPEFLILKQIRPENFLGVLELRPHVSYQGYWDFDGRQVSGRLHVDNHWEWSNGYEVHTGMNFTTEGVYYPLDEMGNQVAFEISDGIFVPEDIYNHQEAQIVFITNQSKPVNLSTRHVIGGFFGGNRSANSGVLGIRVGDKFNTQFAYQRNDVSLDQGDFATNIFKSRLSYSFTPRILVQSLIQYNSVAELWLSNIRFSILQQANTGLFVVYNELREGDGSIRNRSFTIKYSMLFDLLK